MSTSTDGEISFGVKFEEDFEFPWIGDEYESEHEEWWRDVNGYKPSFDTETDFIPWYEERSAFDEKRPFPFALVNYQHGDFETYILAVESSTMRARRGHPVDFKPKELTVSDDEVKALTDFISKYLNTEDVAEEDLRPRWWLSSYWG